MNAAILLLAASGAQVEYSPQLESNQLLDYAASYRHVERTGEPVLVFVHDKRSEHLVSGFRPAMRGLGVKRPLGATGLRSVASVFNGRLPAVAVLWRSKGVVYIERSGRVQYPARRRTLPVITPRCFGGS
jgi:hypothetical protein